MDSDVARSSKYIQRVELKPNTQLSSTGRLVTKWRVETQERTKFDRVTLNQEKHDNVTDPTSTGKPVSGHESTERCVLTLEHAEDDETGTGRLSRWIKKRNTKLISLRVQELVQRIENHPHQAALQDDLQQTNIYNPFSENSMEMIRELGNVELFELCETTPKVQCSHCLLY